MITQSGHRRRRRSSKRQRRRPLSSRFRGSKRWPSVSLLLLLPRPIVKVIRSRFLLGCLRKLGQLPHRWYPRRPHHFRLLSSRRQYLPRWCHQSRHPRHHLHCHHRRRRRRYHQLCHHRRPHWHHPRRRRRVCLPLRWEAQFMTQSGSEWALQTRRPAAIQWIRGVK